MTPIHKLGFPASFRAFSLSALIVIATLVAGCGPGHGAAGVSTTLTIWYSTDDPVERAWSQQLAQRFEHTHPAVRAHLVDYSFEDLNTKLQLALAAGDPPDLAYVTPRGPGIPAYTAAHRLRNLTVAAHQHGWAGKLRSGLLAAYNRPFASTGAKPGEIVAVPTALAAVGILYNRHLLTRLHLSVPRSIPAFQAALSRARAAGYTPIGLGNGDGWLGDDWYLTLVNALVPPASLASEQRVDPRFSFRRPPFQRAARMLQRWANRGYFTNDFGGLDAQEGVDQFFHGKTVFQLVSSSEDSQILQDQRQTRLPVGVFAFPGLGGHPVMPVSGYEGWVVPAASRHPQQAIGFIDSLLSPSTGRFLLRHGVVPAHAGVSADVPQVAAAWQQDYVQALDHAQPGIYLDAAPVPSLNATMEANVQLLLQGYEPPSFLVKSLQEVYASHGSHGSTARIDGEF